MLRAVGLEASNSTISSPELNWMKVTKGRRSSKPIGRSSNWGGKLNSQSPRRVGDFSSSDSDKLFHISSEADTPDKVGQIPIKKRRHLLATPTQSEEIKLISNHNHQPSGNLSSTSYPIHQLAALKFCNGVRDGISDDDMLAEIAKGMSYYNSDDFSGIALLAAAACSNVMDGDFGTGKGPKDQLEKDKTPESESPDSLKTPLAIPHGLDEDDNQPKEHSIPVSPKVDRLYWDLNAPMDSWGQPLDDQSITKNTQNDIKIKEKGNQFEMNDFGEGKTVPEISDSNLRKNTELSEASDKDSTVRASRTLTSQAVPTVVADVSLPSTTCEDLSSVNNKDIGQPMMIGSLFIENCHKSDISHVDHGKMLGGKEMNSFRAGYDSPFEDGELRGSGLCRWEDNGIYGEDAFAVDYDSDGNGMCDHHGSEVLEGGGSEEGSQGCSEKRLSSLSGGVVESDFSRSVENLKVQTRRFDSRTEGNYARKSRALGLRWSYNEDIGFRTDREKLHLRTEGPMYLDSKDRKNSTLLDHRRPHRHERDFTSEKCARRYRSGFHPRDRSPGDGHLVGNTWDSRNRFLSSYHHAPEDQGHPRRRTFAADVTERLSRMDSRDQRFYSSKCTERRPPGFRRRLVVDGDDCYRGPRRMGPVRSGSDSYYCSQKSSRGDFKRHAGNFSLPSDNGVLSVKMQKCYSRKSRSRSRSSSPQAWRYRKQRDWNPPSMKHCMSGRSPDPKRMRDIPFKKSYVRGGEYGERFVSPPRRHFSPNRKFKWTDNQHFVGKHGRSPVREMSRSERFDGYGSTWDHQFKSNGNFRQARRVSVMGGGGMRRGSSVRRSVDIVEKMGKGHDDVDENLETADEEKDVRCSDQRDSPQGTTARDNDSNNNRKSLIMQH
ncbi:unnamed protein product [Cuscuta epithymum]|uniref:Btz domain-containing protein n=1 Tax=Cuscuta epithymum TaxID=186058 RepID=A0AAV0ELR2_9ASTE|nr:unnamed protein product [Cuscuta epithymum]